MKSKQKVIAFGGLGWIGDLNSIEMYDDDNESWTFLDIKMKIARRNLAHIGVSSTFFRNMDG